MKTILVVDDEKDLRELLKIRFETSGFKCLTAKDGKEGVRIARKEKPSLILLDLIMPRMDGFAAHKALKADGGTKHMPIITYTAQPPEVVAEKGLDALDVVDFVLKPFDAKALILSVDRIIYEEAKNNR